MKYKLTASTVNATWIECAYKWGGGYMKIKGFNSNLLKKIETLSVFTAEITKDKAVLYIKQI